MNRNVMRHLNPCPSPQPEATSTPPNNNIGEADQILSHLKVISAHLKSISEQLFELSNPTNLGTIGYQEAAEALGISLRKMTDLVNEGELEEGYHFQRVGKSVRFPADLAKRFFKKKPTSARKIEHEASDADATPSHHQSRPAKANRPLQTNRRTQINLDF